MINNEEEIWKSHPDFEKLEVSTFGGVRSVEGHYYKGCPDKDGYLRVSFRMNGKCVGKMVHRLVAETFINNPDGFPMVNHKDCDRTNNSADNLEWCDNSYNMQYREKFGEAQGIPLFAINLNTLEISHFGSQKEAERELGILHQNIGAVIKGKRKRAGSYWFVNDDSDVADAIKQKLYEIKHQTVK